MKRNTYTTNPSIKNVIYLVKVLPREFLCGFVTSSCAIFTVMWVNVGCVIFRNSLFRGI